MDINFNFHGNMDNSKSATRPNAEADKDSSRQFVSQMAAMDAGAPKIGAENGSSIHFENTGMAAGINFSADSGIEDAGTPPEWLSNVLNNTDN